MASKSDYQQIISTVPGKLDDAFDLMAGKSVTFQFDFFESSQTSALNGQLLEIAIRFFFFLLGFIDGLNMSREIFFHTHKMQLRF